MPEHFGLIKLPHTQQGPTGHDPRNKNTKRHAPRSALPPAFVDRPATYVAKKGPRQRYQRHPKQSGIVAGSVGNSLWKPRNRRTDNLLQKVSRLLASMGCPHTGVV